MIPAGLLHRVCLVLSVAWAAVIFYLSSRSTLPIPSLFPMQDKLMHIVAYGVLGFLVSGARSLPSLPASATGFLWKSVLLCGLYGLSDEIHQAFVPGRDADVYDLCADVAGALIGSLIMIRLLRHATRLQTS